MNFLYLSKKINVLQKKLITYIHPKKSMTSNENKNSSSKKELLDYPEKSNFFK